MCRNVTINKPALSFFPQAGCPSSHPTNSVGALSLSVLTAIFQVNLGWPVFIEAKDDGRGGDNWSYKSCKAPAKSSPPTNQHPAFLQAGCPSCRPTNSVVTLKGEYLELTLCNIEQLLLFKL